MSIDYFIIMSIIAMYSDNLSVWVTSPTVFDKPNLPFRHFYAT